MSDVADRLRTLANLATSGRKDTTDVIVRAASRAVARKDLGGIAPELARGYADALDALALVEGALRFKEDQEWFDEDIRPLLAAAARLFPEDEA